MTTTAELLKSLNALGNDTARYTKLANLRRDDENAYFNALISNPVEVMPLVYTPTVGTACVEYSNIWPEIPHDAGLFLQLGTDTGKIASKLVAFKSKGVKVIVVTDGERILGLGDLGANGMGIPVGKMALYAGLGGIPPEACMPVTLDVGSNTASVLENPKYIGLKQKRAVVGTPEYTAYLAFVEEFVQAVRSTYGDNCLIQWEDFGNHNAFALLQEYRDRCCCFNDDVQGTAAVALAGMLAGSRLTKRSLADEVVLFSGAGEAGCGIAELISQAVAFQTGKTAEEARKNIWLFDSKGLIYKGRATGGIASHKAPFAHEASGAKGCTTLLEAVKFVKPTTLIGVSAQPGTFTPEVLGAVAQVCETPFVFPLSNPTSKAECTAAEAYQYTENRAVVATGSPFPDYEMPDHTFKNPGQGNNVYIFPGLGLGTTILGAMNLGTQILVDDDDMRIAAEVCSGLVTDEQLGRGNVYPPLTEIRTVAASIAQAFVNRRVDDASKISLATCLAAMYTPVPAKL